VEELGADAVGGDGGGARGGVVEMGDGWGGHQRILYSLSKSEQFSRGLDANQPYKRYIYNKPRGD
jgi:hypothetical protein